MNNFWLQLVAMIGSHFGFWDKYWRVPSLQQLIYEDHKNQLISNWVMANEISRKHMAAILEIC